MTTEEIIAEERKKFEQAAYARFVLKKAMNQVNLELMGDGSYEGLFFRLQDGTYGVQMWNAAWWGWKASKGLA